jgi:hypothetical protein
MSNPTKPAWGSYAELKRVQRERERAAATPPAPVPVDVEPDAAAEAPLQTGHPQTGHPQTGHPQTGHPVSTVPGTHEPDTQSPTARAPGHPDAGARVPELRAPSHPQTGHPGTHEPGTHIAPFRAPTSDRAHPNVAPGDARESPYWPSRQYKTRLNLRFPGDLAAQLDEYCRAHGLSKQDAAEIAIRRLIAEARAPNRAPGHPQTGHPQTGHPEQWVPEKPHDHDDEDDDRIIIYQQMTGNRVNARDRAAFAEVRHLRTDVIREGIRLSVERAPTPVKSFRYCLGAIHEVAARGAAPPATKRPVEAEGIGARSRDEVLMLARAVVRQLGHDAPSLQGAELRTSLLEWSREQGIADAEAIVDAALAAEGRTP